MRTSWNGVLRGVALLAFLAVVGLPSAFADGPFDPPESRIRPPSGVTSQSRIRPPSGEPATDARIGPPPGGVPQPDARIQPPSGEPSFFELVLDWLQAQARIHPPIG